MIAKTPEDIEGLRKAGQAMTAVVAEVLALVKPGVSSMTLEHAAREATKRQGARPSYLGYKVRGERAAYPAALCVSVNEQIAHSPPSEQKILREGDVVSIDFGLDLNGFYMDTAQTLAVGKVDAEANHLIMETLAALEAGVAVARAGGRISDISRAVANAAKSAGLGVGKDLRGHGVVRAVHELPNIPNYVELSTDEILPEGLVIAIEPLLAEKSGAMVVDVDGFGYSTRDHSRAAHFEQTVLLTKDGAEILTPFS